MKRLIYALKMACNWFSVLYLKRDNMQISVTPESKKKVPYKTLFLTLIYIDNRYGLEISGWGSNQSRKYMDNVKEFREKW